MSPCTHGPRISPSPATVTATANATLPMERSEVFATRNVIIPAVTSSAPAATRPFERPSNTSPAVNREASRANRVRPASSPRIQMIAEPNAVSPIENTSASPSHRPVSRSNSNSPATTIPIEITTRAPERRSTGGASDPARRSAPISHATK